MKTFTKPADTVSLVSPTGGTVSGTGVLIGQLFGVATATVAQTLPVEVQITGQVTIAKTSALAISPGDVLYWDDTGKVVNKTSAAQKEVGIAVSTAANPSATVEMVLVVSPRTSVAA